MLVIISSAVTPAVSLILNVKVAVAPAGKFPL